ncbi:MAG: hypothetical protein ACKOEM_17565, partial [Planctomycetia bacterium]
MTPPADSSLTDTRPSMNAEKSRRGIAISTHEFFTASYRRACEAPRPDVRLRDNSYQRHRKGIGFMLNTFRRTLGVLLSVVIVLLLTGVRTANAEFLYVTLQTSVARFDISSGTAATIAASKTTVASGLSEAMGLVFGGDGSLYVSQFTPNTISRITSGSVASFASGFTSPRGITMSG